MSGSDSRRPNVVAVIPATDARRTDMHAAPGKDTLAARTAACFACLQDPDADPKLHAHWTAWLAESPQHAQAYRTLAQFWDAVPAAVPHTAARQHPALPTWRATTPPPSRPAWQLGALAASVLLLAIAGAWQQLQPAETEPQIYATERGQQRRLSLEDGSSVLLDADSRLLVRFEAGRRNVHLVQGQALFDVAHDPQRPFTVRAGDGEIRAVGTEFDVLVSPSGVDVTLLQGAVIVAPLPLAAGGNEPQRRVARLAPGQQVSYRQELGQIRTVDPAIVTAWRDGRPTYLDQPLGKVVADLARYHGRAIQLADPALAELRYTGTVSVQDLASWVRALEQAYPVHAGTGTDGALVLRQKLP
jgi:transmembrane sensor